MGSKIFFFFLFVLGGIMLQAQKTKVFVGLLSKKCLSVWRSTLRRRLPTFPNAVCFFTHGLNAQKKPTKKLACSTFSFWLHVEASVLLLKVARIKGIILWKR